MPQLRYRIEQDVGAKESGRAHSREPCACNCTLDRFSGEYGVICCYLTHSCALSETDCCSPRPSCHTLRLHARVRVITMIEGPHEPQAFTIRPLNFPGRAEPRWVPFTVIQRRLPAPRGACRQTVNRNRGVCRRAPRKKRRARLCGNCNDCAAAYLQRAPRVRVLPCVWRQKVSMPGSVENGSVLRNSMHAGGHKVFALGFSNFSQKVA